MPRSHPSHLSGEEPPDHVSYTVKELVSSLHAKIDKLDTRVASLEKWMYALPLSALTSAAAILATVLK